MTLIALINLLSFISNFLSLLVFCNIRNGRKVATLRLLIPLWLWRCLVCLLVRVSLPFHY